MKEHPGEKFQISKGYRLRRLTLEGCRRELREALSYWIALRLKLGLFIPISVS